MRQMIRRLCDEEGVLPIFFFGDLRDSLMSTQEEADFFYDFICERIPKDHWIQPGNTAVKPGVRYLRKRVGRGRS